RGVQKSDRAAWRNDPRAQRTPAGHHGFPGSAADGRNGMSSCAVLVVDDEAAMRTALEASFRRNGWNVATASGAGDALAKFRTTPCPLVVTDVRMPDGDGLQVMQGVREMAPETAVIFLTAYGTVTEAVQAIKEGA